MKPIKSENSANAAVPAQAARIAIVVGARPNFMKAAPIIRAIHGHNQESGHRPIEHLLVHTGQHYDEAMSDRFFTDLGLPQPDVHLGVGSGSHAAQTAEIMKKFEQVLLDKKPDVVVVVGDVNSTVGCALVTAKISFDSAGRRPLIAHVEAGLRSFDRTMPEEINRIVTDHLSDLLFVTEESGLDNLRHERISQDKIHFVGNTMIDSLLAFKEKAEGSAILETLGFRSHAPGNGTKKSLSPYALLTLHRPANVDNRDSFQNILGGLEDLAQDRPIVFPVHPRTRQRIKDFGLDLPTATNPGNHNIAQGSGNRKGVILVDPLGYLDFLCLMKHASIVVTDSGGIQEETTCLGVPCVTVRENTERPATVKQGSNVVAGTSKNGIKEAIRNQMARRGSSGVPKNWDGRAAERIVHILSAIAATSDTSVPRLIPQSCV